MITDKKINIMNEVTPAQHLSYSQDYEYYSSRMRHLHKIEPSKQLLPSSKNHSLLKTSYSANPIRLKMHMGYQAEQKTPLPN